MIQNKSCYGTENYTIVLTLVSGGAHHGLVEDVLVRNVTLSKPYFEVRHLESGVRFEARVFASNRKGRSTPVTLRVSTLKRPEGKRMATIASGSGRKYFLTHLIYLDS